MASGSILAAATPMLTFKKRRGKKKECDIVGVLMVSGKFRFKGSQKFQQPSFLRLCSSHHITSKALLRPKLKLKIEFHARAAGWRSKLSSRKSMTG